MMVGSVVFCLPSIIFLPDLFSFSPLDSEFWDCLVLIGESSVCNAFAGKSVDSLCTLSNCLPYRVGLNVESGLNLEIVGIFSRSRRGWCCVVQNRNGWSISGGFCSPKLFSVCCFSEFSEFSNFCNYLGCLMESCEIE